MNSKLRIPLCWKEQAQRKGKKNGYQAAQEGWVLKSSEQLKQDASKYYPDEAAQHAYVEAYVETYTKAGKRKQGSLVEQAQRKGKANGRNAVRQGSDLKSQEQLKQHASEHYLEDEAAQHAYVEAYTNSWKSKQGSLVEQAQRKGKINGHKAAYRGFVIKSPDRLKVAAIKLYPENEAAQHAYVEAYTSAWKSNRGSPVEQGALVEQTQGKDKTNGHLGATEAETSSYQPINTKI